MILEKLHRAINNFNKTFNWGVCWLFKINYNPDLIAVAWAVPVLLDTLVNKAYDWNNEVRDWD